MAVTVSRSSRLIFGELRTVDGVEFWDLLDLPTFQPGEEDITHVVQEGERIDSIAYRYYQDAVLWWVVAWANSIELPQRELSPGVELVVPSPIRVSEMLSNAKVLRQ